MPRIESEAALKHLAAEGIVLLWSIDRNPRDRIACVAKNVFIFTIFTHGGAPHALKLQSGPPGPYKSFASVCVRC